MERHLRKPYPSHVTDEERSFVAPYLSLMRVDASQRTYDPREVFNALRWIVRTGAPWRFLPTNFPPWPAVHQQTQRWLAVGGFADMVHDLRALLRWTESRGDDPTAIILDSRTVQSTPESGGRAGYDGHKRRKGSKLHLAVYPLGHLLALRVTPASEQDRDQVGALAAAVQETTGDHVQVAFVDQSGTEERLAAAAKAHGIRLEFVKLPEAKRGFVLLPRCAGSSSARLAGRRDSVAWPVTMNACRKGSLACISSPSRACCSIAWSPSRPKVHNNL